MQQPANPYRSPDATVADRGTPQRYGEIKPFSPAGRLGRVRYIAYSFVMGLAIYIPVLVLLFALGPSGAIAILPIVMGLLGIIGLVISFIFTIQRCHDFNVTGWLSLLVLVPLGVFVFWFVPGTQGENRFGSPPPPNSKAVIAVAIIIPIVLIAIAIAASVFMTQMGAGMAGGMNEEQMKQFEEQLKQLEKPEQK